MRRRKSCGGVEGVRMVAFTKAEVTTFIFESFDSPGKPMGTAFFRNALERELDCGREFC
jgi:hypothetical protein